MDFLVEERERGKGLRAYIRLGKGASVYEIETQPPSEEDLRMHRELDALQRRLSELLRRFEHRGDGLEDVLLKFCVAVTRCEESTTQLIRRGRVLRVIAGRSCLPESDEELRAAERAIQEWTNPRSRVEAMMLKLLVVQAEIGDLRKLVQLRRPFDVSATDPFGNLMMPSTLDEWRTARRVLEKALFDVGCDDPEIGEILPDGVGDGSRRVAARRTRMTALKVTD